MFDFGSLLQNKALLSGASQLGAVLSPKVGGGLNMVNQGLIRAENFKNMQDDYMKMFSGMLGGDIPEGASMTFDSKGGTFKLPFGGDAIKSQVYQGLTQGDFAGGPSPGGGSALDYSTGLGRAQIGSALPGGSGKAWSQPPGMFSREQYGAVNPFASSQLGNYSLSDLAGLTPEDISGALSGAMSVEALKQQKLGNTIDAMYKLGRLQQAGAPEPTFVEDVPGYGDLTLSEYKALPTSTKEYASHVLAARKIGEEPMSMEEFESIEEKDKVPTTAMGASIARYVEETGELPPPEELSRWSELYRQEPRERERPLMGWTSATKELKQRFGKLDPTGMWAITPELQATHRKAQEYLVDLKQEGYEPLEAINKAEREATEWKNNIESKYFDYMAKAGGDEEKVSKVRSAFYNQYGYVPTRRGE